MSLTQIDQYEAIYSSNAFPRRIGLKGGGNFIGQLLFHPNGEALPPDGITNNQVILHYHVEDFENVINLLRNEKPMFLLYSGSGPGDENGVIMRG